MQISASPVGFLSWGCGRMTRTDLEESMSWGLLAVVAVAMMIYASATAQSTRIEQLRLGLLHELLRGKS